MKEIKNIPASVQTRLQNHATDRGRQYQEILHYYAMERFLYRLSQTKYKKSFVLKGGLSFLGWEVDLRRPTRDIDFQAMDIPQEELREIIEEICSIPDEKDGMIFDTEKMQIDRIMEEKEKGGFRFRFQAILGRSRVRLQIDVSSGNVITPQEVIVEYPTLLNMHPFELYSYNRETAMAEKVEAMVSLGRFNGRLKDYFDIYHLANTCSFDGQVLMKAFQATFTNRKTVFPEGIPPALSDEFAVDRQEEWLAFVNKNSFSQDEMGDFGKILTFLVKFLMPVIEAERKKENLVKVWKAGEDWVKVSL
jgi:predicted nucleotidyltransferase component of viral defense system